MTSFPNIWPNTAIIKKLFYDRNFERTSKSDIEKLLPLSSHSSLTDLRGAAAIESNKYQGIEYMPIAALARKYSYDSIASRLHGGPIEESTPTSKPTNIKNRVKSKFRLNRGRLPNFAKGERLGLKEGTMSRATRDSEFNKRIKPHPMDTPSNAQRDISLVSASGAPWFLNMSHYLQSGDERHNSHIPVSSLWEPLMPSSLPSSNFGLKRQTSVERLQSWKSSSPLDPDSPVMTDSLKSDMSFSPLSPADSNTTTLSEYLMVTLPKKSPDSDTLKSPTIVTLSEAKRLWRRSQLDDLANEPGVYTSDVNVSAEVELQRVVKHSQNYYHSYSRKNSRRPSIGSRSVASLTIHEVEEEGSIEINSRPLKLKESSPTFRTKNFIDSIAADTRRGSTTTNFSRKGHPGQMRVHEFAAYESTTSLLEREISKRLDPSSWANDILEWVDTGIGVESTSKSDYVVQPRTYFPLSCMNSRNQDLEFRQRLQDAVNSAALGGVF